MPTTPKLYCLLLLMNTGFLNAASIHDLAMKKNIIGIKALLKQGVPVNKRDRHGRTALHYAAAIQAGKLYSFLVSKGADESLRDNNGMKPLYYAGILPVNRYAGTALHNAAGKGNIKRMRHLIAVGANINRYSFWGSPLILAAYHGRKNAVLLLIGKKADLNTRGGGEKLRTALAWAVLRDHAGCAGALILAGADPNIKGEAKGKTALYYAAENGYPRLLKMMIERGGKINSTNRNGRTPLMEAANKGKRACVKVLLDAGANVSKKDKDGCTTLYYAGKWNYKSIVKILKAKGAK